MTIASIFENSLTVWHAVFLRRCLKCCEDLQMKRTDCICFKQHVWCYLHKAFPNMSLRPNTLTLQTALLLTWCHVATLFWNSGRRPARMWCSWVLAAKRSCKNVGLTLFNFSSTISWHLFPLDVCGMTAQSPKDAKKREVRKSMKV